MKRGKKKKKASRKKDVVSPSSSTYTRLLPASQFCCGVGCCGPFSAVGGKLTLNWKFDHSFIHRGHNVTPATTRMMTKTKTNNNTAEERKWVGCFPLYKDDTDFFNRNWTCPHGTYWNCASVGWVRKDYYKYNIYLNYFRSVEVVA